MSRLTDIIAKVRYSVNDLQAKVWTDARLLAVIDEAQQDIVNKIGLLRGVVNIDPVLNISEYTLPSNVLSVTRAAWKSSKIPIVSHDWMDDNNPGWQTATGSDVKYVLTDKINSVGVRIYPVITDIANTAQSQVGVVTATGTTNYSTAFLGVPQVGALTYITQLQGLLELKTRDAAPAVAAITDTLSVPVNADKALMHYATHKLYLDKLDKFSLDMARHELNRYSEELRTLQGVSSSNYAETEDNGTTFYAI